jgi:hypothetical protein
MGAEITMRDSRSRTAMDTAIKRQHLSLLVWLDTQVQTRRVAENVRLQRTAKFWVYGTVTIIEFDDGHGLGDSEVI